MKNSIALLVIFLMSITPSFSQKLEPIKIDFMMRGYFYAQTSVNDKNALGGFGVGGSKPQEFTSAVKKVVKQGEVNIYIETSEIVPFWNKYEGYTVYLINGTDSTSAFPASDSRLSIIAEVKQAEKDEWQAVEYLPSSWCGNSYHTVFLRQGEFWQFECPKYSGKIPVKLRFRLRTEQGKYIY